MSYETALDAALTYAGLGWPVLPVHGIRSDGLCTCAKADCPSAGKHPLGKLVRNGVKGATIDEVTIRRWWRRHPDANVGLATDGLLVVDIDPQNGGELADLSLFGELPGTVTATTGGGGYHLIFSRSDPSVTISCSSGLAGRRGIDVRADGGYIVAPPSLHVSGGQYAWFYGPEGHALADAPQWLVDLARTPSHAAACGETQPSIFAGERNTHLYRVGRALHAKGCGEETIVAALGAENTTRCDPPLPESEVGGIARKADIQADKPIFAARRVKGAKPAAVASSRAAEAILHDSGVAALSKGATAVAAEPCLRKLAELLVGVDTLTVSVVQSTAAALLKAAGIGDARRLVAAAVAPLTQADSGGTGQGVKLVLPDPEPWPHAVNGVELLDELEAVHNRYVVLPQGAAEAAALWDLHTYAIDAAQVSPILAYTSPVKRCGKSTALDVHAAIARRAVSAGSITAAAVFRIIEAAEPTLLIDEADTFLADRDELRGILNAGHTRSARVIRCVGDEYEPRAFAVFCAKAMAAIGELPGTIEDRAITIGLVRRGRGEPVERLRRDGLSVELLPLRRRLVRWAQDNVGALRDADPAVPDALHDRAADNWRPLLAIADLAGGGWPARARRAALTLNRAGDDDGDARTLLLADLRGIFDEIDADQLPSATIVQHLTAMEHRPWPEWNRGKPLTAPGLARLLKPYGVRPKQLWIDADNERGYTREALAPVWSRYLPQQEPLGPLESLSHKGSGSLGDPLDPPASSASAKSLTARKDGSLAGLADGSVVGAPKRPLREPT